MANSPKAKNTNSSPSASSAPEAETSIVYDYHNKTVMFYTTRVGEFNNMKRRLGDSTGFEVIEEGNRGGAGGWSVIIPISACRKASTLFKVLASTEKDIYEESVNDDVVHENEGNI